MDETEGHTPNSREIALSLAIERHQGQLASTDDIVQTALAFEHYLEHGEAPAAS